MRPIDADALEKDYRMQFEAVYKHTRDAVIPSDFYIERKAAYDKELMKMEMEAFFKYLQGRPTIDAVPVVRCKDCQWFMEHTAAYRSESGKDGSCACLAGFTDCGKEHRTYMDFCSYGRRKEAEVEK